MRAVTTIGVAISPSGSFDKIVDRLLHPNRQIEQIFEKGLAERTAISVHISRKSLCMATLYRVAQGRRTFYALQRKT